MTEHDFQHVTFKGKRHPSPQRRCTKCEIWETPHSRQTECPQVVPGRSEP